MPARPSCSPRARLPSPRGRTLRFIRGPVAQALPAIREAAGGRDIWVVGGGDLAGQFADAGALDRIELTVAPVALAAGAPLLPRRLEAARVSLIDVERYGQFAHLTYGSVPPIRSAIDERDTWFRLSADPPTCKNSTLGALRLGRDDRFMPHVQYTSPSRGRPASDVLCRSRNPRRSHR